MRPTLPGIKQAQLRKLKGLRGLVKAYKKICEIAGVPQLIIDNPGFIISQTPTEQDKEWAMALVEKYQSGNPIQPQETESGASEAEAGKAAKLIEGLIKLRDGILSQSAYKLDIDALITKYNNPK